MHGSALECGGALHGWVCMCGGNCACACMSMHVCMSVYAGGVCARAWECVWVCWAYLQCSTSQMLTLTWFSLYECFDLCSTRK